MCLVVAHQYNKDYTINMVFSLFNLRLGLMSNYKLVALHLKWSEPVNATNFYGKAKVDQI